MERVLRPIPSYAPRVLRPHPVPHMAGRPECVAERAPARLASCCARSSMPHGFG